MGALRFTTLSKSKMPRMARVVLPGTAHHLTQRGSRRSNVFLDDADRESYIHILLDCCRRFHLHVCAYCLMSNHVHFVVIPEREDSLWKTFHRCHGMYATRFNLKYGLSGHLWQARPYSCVLDEDHLWAAIRYVERNPVRAGMVACAEDYRWSSAAAHCGLQKDAMLEAQWLPPHTIQDWRHWLEEESDVLTEQRIRDRTFTGRPCGDEKFVRTTEKLLGRSLARRKPGPKSKQPLLDGEPLDWTTEENRF
jgi:putative transposase